MVRSVHSKSRIDLIRLLSPGRHALGTLIGLHEAFQKLPNTKRTQFKAHLTLLDVHDAQLHPARDGVQIWRDKSPDFGKALREYQHTPMTRLLR